MTTTDVLAASQQELGLYQELWAVYDRLAAGLAEADTDATALTDHGQRAAAVTAALRDLAVTLAPHRLAPETVHEDVTAVWRASATLAAATAEANRRLQAAAQARRNRVATQLGQIATGAAAGNRYRQAVR